MLRCWSNMRFMNGLMFGRRYGAVLLMSQPGESLIFVRTSGAGSVMAACAKACAVACLLLSSLAFSEEAEQVAEPANKTESAPPAEATPAPSYSLDTVLKQLEQNNQQARKDIAARESRYRERLNGAKARLERTKQKLAATEAEGRRLEQNFEDNRVELDDKAKLLKDKLGALKELFGVFQQNASDLIGAFNSSATSIQFPGRDEWLEGFANRMKNASEVSSVEDIMGLWFEMQREITALGDIVQLRGPVVNTSGESSEQSYVRIGGFSLISQDPEPAYLFWSDAGQEVLSMSRQPDPGYLGQIDSYLDNDDELNTVGVDPTGSILTALLAQKPTTEDRVHQGGLVGYIIITLGAVALLLAAYKLFDIAQISLRVQKQQRDLSNPRADNVLGQLLQVYQRNLHVDSETLEMRLHEAVQKAILRVNRFTIFLGIIAAVAPLLGLLGTVVGMINTFQAITLYGTGDPQTMAGGISQALITTVLGLVVAVPAVLLHAIVSGRGKSVVNVLQQQSAALTGDSIEQEHQSQPVGTEYDNGSLPDPAPA